MTVSGRRIVPDAIFACIPDLLNTWHTEQGTLVTTFLSPPQVPATPLCTRNMDISKTCAQCVQDFADAYPGRWPLFDGAELRAGL